MKTLYQAPESGLPEVSRNEPKTSKTTQRKLYHLARFLMWCGVNLLLLPGMRLMVRKFRLVSFVFVVYPGTQTDITSYIPLWLHRRIRKILPLSVLGISSGGNTRKRGLIITLMSEPEAFTREELSEMLGEMESFARSVGAGSIALAGRIPGVILAHGLPLNDPFLKGDRGGVFTVTETLLYALKIEGLTSKHTIGILGVGFLGGKVLRHLRDIGFSSLIGFDPRAKGGRDTNPILTNDPNMLTQCKVVVVLTGKGSDIADSIPYFSKGIIVIDDTHPQLPSTLVEQIRTHGGKIYKATLGLEGVRFFPKIPGYGAEWLPGCVIEALNGHNGHNQTQQEFDQRGRELGLRPLLVHSRGGE